MSDQPIQLALQQALQTAFRQCEADGIPLSPDQQQLVQQMTQTLLLNALAEAIGEGRSYNPLTDLSPEQRQALLDYVAECDRQQLDWKTTLFNDWLQGRESGSVQFLRDRYGFDWINRIESRFLAAYADKPADQLRIGDRIEISSRLWEWIPEEMGEEPVWVMGTLIRLDNIQEDNAQYLNSTVRFENGLELDIAGIDDWNRNNWRWPQPPAQSDPSSFTP